ncbi:MAG: DUF4286 family protein [Flammeovirgaceae bacterium]|jgi:hypothetical protein|nr:DUF4286 family protein [Flammeovirgaceae bacterium]
MFLYNVTVGIDKEIEKDWVAWIKQNYLPAVAATGFFVESKMYRIVTHDDETSVSYSIQLFAHRIEDVVQYLAQHTDTIIETHRQRFKDRHVVFNTLLEEV